MGRVVQDRAASAVPLHRHRLRVLGTDRLDALSARVGGTPTRRKIMPIFREDAVIVT
ncbi:hypothetical protein BURMUCGD2M_4543 [Burkholderia multivorans CGD2M]|uniref:Uncharacterized protein n=1 Tax=Burkholderia multivorans CGD2 TaxID=513052 RepID=B9BHK0_9BURK|nr:hypothetical protein BURMUCGD2_4555 [Burkholderia multivorans CGD2]EEE15101.1 hypothetical protein BURMUCGD2M_4543 [Burkholderia multivorans CGD2M]